MNKENINEVKRLKNGIYAIVATLRNNNVESALQLARIVMYGGDVLNPLDFEALKSLDNKESKLA